MPKSPNEQLLAAIRLRGQKQTEFRYGILTADRYVTTLQQAVGLDQCYRFMAKGSTSYDDLIRKAARTLVYSNPDMELEEIGWTKAGGGSLGNLDLPKNTLMAFRHVLTSSTKDRDGDVLHSDGASVDPRMLLLWQHVHTLPIGRLVKVASQNPNRLTVISCIVDMNELSHDAAVMVDNGMARFSHGFRAMDFRENKEGTGKENGFDVKRFEIMEESMVSVPANPEAETEEVLLSLVEGGKLTSPLMKEVGKGIRQHRNLLVPGVEVHYRERNGEYEKELVCGSFVELRAAVEAGLIGGAEKGGPGSGPHPGDGTPKGDDAAAAKLSEQADKTQTYNDHAAARDAHQQAASHYREGSPEAEYHIDRAAEHDEMCDLIKDRGKGEHNHENKSSSGSGAAEGTGSGGVEGDAPSASEEAQKAAAGEKAGAGDKEGVKAELILCPECEEEVEPDAEGCCPDCGCDLEEEVEEETKGESGMTIKAGRVLNTSNFKLIQKALNHVDDVRKEEYIKRPHAAQLNEASAHLGQVLQAATTTPEGEGDTGNRLSIYTTSTAAAHFLVNASPEERKRMLTAIKAIEDVDTIDEDAKAYREMTGQVEVEEKAKPQTPEDGMEEGDEPDGDEDKGPQKYEGDLHADHHKGNVFLAGKAVQAYLTKEVGMVCTGHGEKSATCGMSGKQVASKLITKGFAHKMFTEEDDEKAAGKQRVDALEIKGMKATCIHTIGQKSCEVYLSQPGKKE